MVGCVGGLFVDVVFYGGVEGVVVDDVVDVSGGDVVWFDDGVEMLDGEG